MFCGAARTVPTDRTAKAGVEKRMVVSQMYVLDQVLEIRGDCGEWDGSGSLCLSGVDAAGRYILWEFSTLYLTILGYVESVTLTLLKTCSTLSQSGVDSKFSSGNPGQAMSSAESATPLRNLGSLETVDKLHAEAANLHGNHKTCMEGLNTIPPFVLGERKLEWIYSAFTRGCRIWPTIGPFLLVEMQRHTWPIGSFSPDKHN